MNMTSERFKLIIEAYSCDSLSWPEDEREAAQAYLQNNASAQALVSDYQQLDDLLLQHQLPSLSLIEKRVIANAESSLKPGFLESIIDWLTPRSEHLWTTLWRPALAASLPIFLGIYLSNFYSFGLDNGNYTTMEEELALLSLNDYAELSQ